MKQKVSERHSFFMISNISNTKSKVQAQPNFKSATKLKIVDEAWKSTKVAPHQERKELAQLLGRLIKEEFKPGKSGELVSKDGASLRASSDSFSFSKSQSEILSVAHDPKDNPKTKNLFNAILGVVQGLGK